MLLAVGACVPAKLFSKCVLSVPGGQESDLNQPGPDQSSIL
jgi:hypothetical protein